MITEYFFADRERLFESLLKDCANRLQFAVDTRGRASFLVSGGGTPKPLYQQLAQTALPWSRIVVALVDERWVAPDQPGSNQRFIRESLLQHQAAAAAYVPMKNDHATAAAGLNDCEKNYRQLPRPFDLTLLGMGPDGHTASLFPAAEGLEQALDDNTDKLCAAINARPSEVTGALTERMTLTRHGLLQSRQLHLLITGEDKLGVYRAAKDNGDFTAMPVSAILQQEQVPVGIYWAP